MVTTEPHFAEPIQNVTVPIDRNAKLSCIVDKLGGNRIAWLKSDSHTILTIHTHVITHNSRIRTSHNGLRQWNLHIDSVKEKDRGFYMCQINTSPMKHQYGYLEVVVPPDISWDETSQDVSVTEGESVSLTCKAVGYPKPTIVWRREDGQLIVLRLENKKKKKVEFVNTESLNISRVHRRHMGVYLCIASNGIPPSVSKRVRLQVNFPPIIKVPNQLVGAPLGTEVELECFVEVSPSSANYWMKDTGAVLINGSKYTVTETPTTHFRFVMRLVIRQLEFKDFGTYNCVSKNSLGEAQGSVRLRVFDMPSTSIRTEVEEGKTIDITKNRQHHTYQFTPVYQNETIYPQHSTERTEAVTISGMNQSRQGVSVGAPSVKNYHLATVLLLILYSLVMANLSLLQCI
uniref:Ig-like domain-containing protein n=1 Tax=Strigamia maritima TaxID=126957 RepID=T1IV88_STRMM